MKRHPIIEVRDDLVICGGEHPTAATHGAAEGTAGAHQMLRPVFHRGEFTADPQVPVKAGDVIEEADDGTKRHIPGPARQQRPER